MRFKRNKFFENTKGAVLGIVSITVGLVGMFISYLAIPGYNILENMVSELGLGPWGIFFNLGFVFSGLLAIPYYLNLSYLFQSENIDHRLINGSIIASVVSCIAYALVGVFPAYKENLFYYWAHGTFAAISGISGIAYLLLFGYMMYNSKIFKKRHAFFSLLISLFYLAFLLTWIPIIEWMASFGIMSWIFFNSLYLLYFIKKREDMKVKTINSDLEKA